MPELPEVETILRELEPLLRGRRVVRAQVTWPRTVAEPDAEHFVREVEGAIFAAFARRGKYLLFRLETEPPLRYLIVHLRMTGRLRVEPAGVGPDAHTHVALKLDDGSSLHFRDPRKFGRLWLTAQPAALLARLGPEADDPAFTSQELGARLQGRTAPIKALLLDQSILAGLGNIYADEALFAAAIEPRRAAAGLSVAEIDRLHGAVQRILAEAVAGKGSSLGDASTNYQRPGGDFGGFQAAHKVFRRTGQPCLLCGAPIERVVVAQRSTHFCPRCQR